PATEIAVERNGVVGVADRVEDHDPGQPDDRAGDHQWSRPPVADPHRLRSGVLDGLALEPVEHDRLPGAAGLGHSVSDSASVVVVSETPRDEGKKHAVSRWGLLGLVV